MLHRKKAITQKLTVKALAVSNCPTVLIGLKSICNSESGLQLADCATVEELEQKLEQDFQVVVMDIELAKQLLLSKRSESPQSKSASRFGPHSASAGKSSRPNKVAKNKKSQAKSGVISRTVKRELTNRELAVLRLTYLGAKNQEIADELNISLPTAKAHMRTIMQKLGVRDRVGVALEGIKLGLV